MLPVRVDTTDPASPVVLIGGIDVSTFCERVIVILERGALPRVILESPAAIELVGLADAVHVDTSGLPAIREWLTHLDPQQLEDNALAKLGMEGETESTGQAFLLALQEVAP